MITAKHSTNGHPLMVGGPQIGYYYPGFTYEIDMQAPGLHWRGATTAPFPGYMLIGRGPDFATTLTSASGDIIDQYAETLCGGSDERYRYKGRCREMGHFDAGTLNGQPVKFLTTVHGPVVGYATLHGRKVAIASKRSSYGKDVLDLLFNRRISDGQVKSPKTFFDAAAKSPQTFNSYYIDSRHIAEYTSGLMPIRPRKVDPGLPTKGTGQYEWRGFLSKNGHIHGVDPKNGQDRQLEQHRRPRLRCSRQQLGRKRFRRAGRSAQPQPRPPPQERQVEPGDGDLGDERLGDPGRAGDRHGAAAGEAAEGLDRAKRAGAADARPAGRLAQARRQPSRQQPRRQDRRPGRGDHGRRLADIANAFMKPLIGPQLDELNSLFSRFDQPPAGQYSGWYQYFQRDIGRLVGARVPQPFANRYCGHGSKTACQQAIWNAIAAAGAQLTTTYGSPDPSTWRADAIAERIHFAPNLVPWTMRYTNRPTGIQQVISFDGHR